ncbi:liprin-beta-1-like isoform X3 [Ctenocephalides felis]|uniref:liprin-beta-1-like isoform X3 n=2 Tax=Ctenocephalides felis TaxID=7515 RepID=UPI000E6E4357|nr:liprin-beta-1-like isoform X3 [Ctenocephalides felis]
MGKIEVLDHLPKTVLDEHSNCDSLTNASIMLEAALSQMDDILSGPMLRSSSSCSNDVLTAARNLAAALNNSEEDPVTTLEPEVTSSISKWINNQRSGPAEERIRRLEADKEQLRLQVCSLTEQVTMQSERAAGLERALQDKQKLLQSAEESLQREMLSRSSLETQKLELLSALSELKLHQASLERDNMELRRLQQQISFNSDNYQSYQQNIEAGKPPAAPRTSTPSGSPANLSPLNLNSIQPSSIPYRNITTHGSLPRHFNSNMNNQRQNSPDDNANLVTNGCSSQRRAVNFGKPRPLVQTIRGFSVPNLAEADQIIAQDLDLQENNKNSNNQPKSPQSILPSPLATRHNKGLLAIFGKMKRSSSGTIDGSPDNEDKGTFSRGGMRATAGGRLGWSENNEERPCYNIPFKEWERERVLSWMRSDLGIDFIENEAAKQIITNGSKLLDATPTDLEKAFTIKSHLHRKKIVLALSDLRGTSDDEHLKNAGKWNTSTVLRWLDDAGLTQYKDIFMQAQIDGRLLHRLNMDDIAALHISNLLHVTSLRRGIQVLREHAWNMDTMIKHSKESDPVPITSDHIARWSVHRIMEWLQHIDLSEYATNLKNTGVHGAMLVHEPRFSSDLLADLLSIPANKTLLRRHLATHFKELLGRDIMQGKREAESTLGFVPLTLTAKVKVPKKSQFSLKRHKSPTLDDLGELVCPMNEKVPDEEKQSRTGCI